ncbi:MAG: hypothetical protein N2508_15230 [Anaerolineae bacterium]|nr:hypothetical protein [Anaerolineae bacterium]
MPTLPDLVARLSFLAAIPAVAGILITANILVVSREWRLNIFALIVQYFFVVMLMTRLIRLEVAAIKGLIGWMICMVFYLTERRGADLARAVRTSVEVQPEAGSARSWQRWTMTARTAFYLLAGLLVSVAAYMAALRFPLPREVIPPDISLACYLMVGLGLLVIGLSETPMQVGMGLLTFLAGFDLFYVAVEPSLVVVGLIGAVSFLIALAASFLRAAQFVSSEQTEGAE